MRKRLAGDPSTSARPISWAVLPILLLACQDTLLVRAMVVLAKEALATIYFDTLPRLSTPRITTVTALEQR